MDKDLSQRLTAALGESYTIERELGGGGMSRVFLATEPALGRRVVIKVLPVELRSPALAQRFRREISVLASLRHPHIIPLLSGGEAGDFLYYTMPYVPGESLRERLDREGAIALADAMRLMRQIGEALGYAHRHGVVHRDLKPANILLEDGNALIADFGIARVISETTGAGITGTGMSVGTPGYMAPEQSAADPATDHRADIFAFGAVAYEMVAGRRPFTGPTHEVVTAQATGRFDSLARVRPGTPSSVDRMITRALDPNPAARWDSAEEMLRELNTVAAPPGRYGLAGKPRARRLAFAAAALAALVAAVGYPLLERHGGAAPPAAASVAVLPFVNMGDSANAYFADGMTEELINALAGVEGLKVPARTSSFAFKGRTTDLRAVAEQLGVSHLIEGSVRRDADRIRVTAQLINAADGFHVWSHAFDAEAQNIFQVQGAISREIVRALLPRLGRAPASLVREGTRSPEAYARYLQGLQEFNRRIGGGIDRAIEHYRAAIGLDSQFVAAHAGLAMAYSQSLTYSVPPIPGALDSAVTAARRAVRLDPNSVEANTALGNALTRHGEMEEALSAFKAAIAANPGYALAHQWYAYALRAIKEPDSAVTHARIAKTLDPLSPSARGALAQMYVSARRFAEAEQEYRSHLAADPSSALTLGLFGNFYVASREYAKAVPLLEGSLEGFPNSVGNLSWLAYAYMQVGRPADAARVAARAERLVNQSRTPSPTYAWVLEARGQHEAAVDWIVGRYERAFVYPLHHPLFDIFRRNPRFRELERRFDVSGQLER